MKKPLIRKTLRKILNSLCTLIITNKLLKTMLHGRNNVPGQHYILYCHFWPWTLNFEQRIYWTVDWTRIRHGIVSSKFRLNDLRQFDLGYCDMHHFPTSLTNGCRSENGCQRVLPRDAAISLEENVPQHVEKIKFCPANEGQHADIM